MMTVMHFPLTYFAPNPSDEFKKKLKDIHPALRTGTVRTGGVGDYALVLTVAKPSDRYYHDGSGPMRKQFKIRCFDVQLPAMEEVALKLARRDDVWKYADEPDSVLDVIGAETTANMDTEIDPTFKRNETPIQL